MPALTRRIFLLIVPILFLFVQCNNDVVTNTSPSVDSIAMEEDTFSLSGIKTSDVLLTETVRSALVFYIDDTMRIGNGYKATLALGKNLLLDDLKKEMMGVTDAQEKDLKVDTTLRVEAEMRARLKDLSPASDKSFDITSLNADGDIQEINEETGNKAFWEWNVIPLKEGKHKLQLVVEVVLNKKRNIFLPSRTMEILIDAKSQSFGSALSGFFEKYWQWMITAIIIPIIIAWLTTRIRQRQQSPAAPPVSKPDDKKK